MHQYFKYLLLIFLLSSSVSNSLIGQPYTYTIEDVLTTKDGLHSDNITALKYYKESNLLIGTDQGLHVYDGYDFLRVTDAPTSLVQINDNHINSIEVDSSGRIWIATNDGLNVINHYAGINNSYFNVGNKKYPPLTKNKNSKTYIRQSPNGTMWIVNNGILCQIINGVVQKFQQENLELLTGNIFSDSQNYIYGKTESNFFVMAPNGTLIFKGETAASSQDEKITINHKNTLVHQDDKGAVILTNYFSKKYYKFNREGNIEKLHKEQEWIPTVLKKIDKNFDGLIEAPILKSVLLKNKHDLIWVGTPHGLVKISIIDAQNINSKRPPAEPYVSRYLKYNAESGNLNMYFADSERNEPIILSPDEKYIQFHFSNEDLSNPTKNSFACYLEGYDKDWIQQGNQKIIRYANLPAGEYVFHLKTANPNGSWNKDPLKLKLIVQQHFYKSSLFIVVCIFSIFVVIALLLYSIWKGINERIELRTKLARDLHDEVSNSFNNIRIVAKEMEPDNAEKTKKDIMIIREMSGQSIELVEDVIWSLDREDQKVEDLIFKFEDYLDDIIRAKNIPLTFTIENLDPDRNIMYLYRRNLILIFKECITNIVKHSKPTHVDILFKATKSKYYFRVTNTFDELIAAPYSTGKGIPGMKERAKFINGKLDVVKSPNKFEVIMILKFPNILTKK